MAQTNTATANATPSSMQAVVIDGFGGADKLHVTQIPVPQLGADEVRIRIRAAGVGIWDAMQREGKFNADNAHFPLVLGAECAGEIVAVGSNVKRSDLPIGSSVYTYFTGNQGAYAEYVNVKASAVAAKPKKLSFEEAGGVPVDAVTAYQAITEQLRLKAGETIFIAGGSGGVGTIAVQLAHKIGAKVIASAGKDNQDYLKSLGADIVVDYTSGDVLDLVRKQAPNGVDVALDCVGGDSAKTTVQAVRDDGRFAELTGTDVGSPRNIEVHHIQSEGTAERLNALGKLFDDGSLRVTVERTYPLAEARAAQNEVEKRHVRGKVVLFVN